MQSHRKGMRAAGGCLGLCWAGGAATVPAAAKTRLRPRRGGKADTALKSTCMRRYVYKEVLQAEAAGRSFTGKAKRPALSVRANRPVTVPGKLHRTVLLCSLPSIESPEGRSHPVAPPVSLSSRGPQGSGRKRGGRLTKRRASAAARCPCGTRGSGAACGCSGGRCTRGRRAPAPPAGREGAPRAQGRAWG